MKKTFITRADDAASSRSANLAIARAVKRGFIRNVSVMAPGAHLDHAAELLAGQKHVCFGLHGTLNAEWDRVKWGPVSDLPRSSGLTDEGGHFLADPALFRETHPPVEAVMDEYAAQLDRLTRAGFAISYLDSHMFPELFIPGMDEAVRDFARRKGLIDHMYYYALPPGLTGTEKNLAAALRRVPEGQYFYVAHPALDTEEMRLTGNSTYSGEQIATARAREARRLGTPGIAFLMRRLGVRPLRYDEAVPLPDRLTPEEVGAIMGAGG